MKSIQTLYFPILLYVLLGKKLNANIDERLTIFFSMNEPEIIIFSFFHVLNHIQYF